MNKSKFFGNCQTINSSVDHCAVKNNSHTDMNILLILYKADICYTEAYQNCTPGEQLMSVIVLFNHIFQSSCLS